MERIGLIGLDMDGTLLASDHATVPQDNVDAIKRATEAGIHVCICTGRMAEDASIFIKQLGLDCMITACNGTRAFDGPLPLGKKFFARNLSASDANRVLDILLPFGMMINGFEDGRVNTVAFEPDQMYHLARRGLIAASYGERAIYEAAERGDVMKFYVVEDGYAGEKASERVALARQAVMTALPHLQITSSAPGNIEIMAPDAGKGVALEAVAQYLGLSSENVMAVGDAQNDLSMLEYAYHSVAMGNACEEVKKVCRYTTSSNDACGVAEIIHRVLDAKHAGC